MNLPFRILIVDDSPEDCATYQRHLTRGGHREFAFSVAHSAARGLEYCQSESPDCVLLDFNLPDQDGLDFLTRLRQEHGANAPPVVMVTGQGNEAIAVKAMKLGVQDYLVKGFSADGLRHSIEQASDYVLLRRRVNEQQLELARLSEAQAQLVQDLEQRTAELSEADIRKNEFLTVLAHELRNPLGPIRNSVQLMQQCDSSLSLIAEKAHEIIDRQVDHMARLIDDLLDVSRIARGKILLRKDTTDLVCLVRSTFDDHRGDLAEAGLNLVGNFPDSEAWVDGDPTRLSQVLRNILDNARKFTPRGGVITMSLSASSGDSVVRLQIADSGEGLDAATLEHMFEVFSQADRSLDRSRSGLGLGLAIVKGLVELHDGNVTASSAGPGLGCTISVSLPLVAKPSHSRLPSPAAIEGSVAKLRILIVEDNKDAADSLGKLLEVIGHSVRVANSGQAGVEAASAFLPELVICDIGLSEGISGYMVAEKIRQVPVLSSIYLVALSGHGRVEDQQRASEAGFDLHVTKPISFQALQDLPRLVLSKSPVGNC